MKTIEDYKAEAEMLKLKTQYTTIVFMLSCFDINDVRFEDGVLAEVDSEEQAIKTIKAMQTDC